MQETKELTTKEKARLMKNAYAREWRKKNPDKVRATMERHLAKKYDAMIDKMVEDLKNDPDINVDGERIDDELLKSIASNYIKFGINLDNISIERGDTE